MDHDDHGPVLDLSDVVHDDTIADPDDNPLTDDDPLSPGHYANPISLDPAALGEPLAGDHHLPGAANMPAFIVEQLEREIASLFNHNVSSSSHHVQEEDEVGNGEDVAGLHDADDPSVAGLSFPGLAAFLQAAHAQAENQRVAEALAATHPELARQKEERERVKKIGRAHV